MGKHRPPMEREPSRWYSLKAWRLRRSRKLAETPWCEACEKHGIIVPAVHVHHLEPVAGSYWRLLHSPIEALCHSCHSQKQGDPKRPSKPKPAWGIDGYRIV